MGILYCVERNLRFYALRSTHYFFGASTRQSAKRPADHQHATILANFMTVGQHLGCSYFHGSQPAHRYSTSTIIYTEAAKPMGKLTPTAVRVCLPASPKTSTTKSDAPFMALA